MVKEKKKKTFILSLGNHRTNQLLVKKNKFNPWMGWKEFGLVFQKSCDQNGTEKKLNSRDNYSLNPKMTWPSEVESDP
jgi:hypothetical protein